MIRFLYPLHRLVGSDRVAHISNSDNKCGYQQLNAYAAQQKRPLSEILNEAVNKTVESILKQPQP